MRRALTVLVLALIAGCSNLSPTRPAEYVTPEGQGWVITYISSALSGSTHIYINGKRVASGSFGIGAGNNASGSGTYDGKDIFFQCTHRYTPSCLIYANGKKIAHLESEPELPIGEVERDQISGGKR